MLAPHLVARVRAERQERRFRAGDASPWVRTTLRKAVQERVNEIVGRHERALAEKGVQKRPRSPRRGRRPRARRWLRRRPPAPWGEPAPAGRPAHRPTSILKPLLYASMLEAGEVLPAQLVPDVPTHIGSFHPEESDLGLRRGRPRRAGPGPLAQRAGRPHAARARR